MCPSRPFASSPGLDAAHAAYAERRWQDALTLLQACDAQQALSRDDLARLAWSAGMLDRDDELLAAFERLFRDAESAGNADAAAYWAFFHGFRLLALGEHGRASAWMQRAQHHAALAGERCAVQGYLLLPQVIRHVMGEQWTAAVVLTAQALDIAGRCGERDLEALARCWQGRALAARGDVEQGVADLDAAMLLALSDALSPVVTGLVYCNLIATCRQVFALDRAREWTSALARWCEAQPQLVQFGGACQLHRAEIFELDGAWQASLVAAREATERAARAGASDVRAGAAYQEGEIHRLRGEAEEARRCYAEAHRLGMDPQPGLALATLEAGEGRQADAMLQRSLASATRPLARARLLPAWIEVLLETGDPDGAAEASAELAALAARFSSEALQAEAAQARGRVRLAQDDAAGALPALEAALAAWLRLQAPFRAAQARVHLAAACVRLGDDTSARMHLESARDSFAGLGAVASQRKLADLLPGRPPGPAPAGLSAREVQVLRLVAAGNTNKAIARALALSEKTVDRHLANIYDKLDVHTRSAATAFAFRHGLVSGPS